MNDKLKVGYVPYSKDLSHPGDRRRLVAWAESTNNILVTDTPLESDLLVISGGANFDYWMRNAKQPVILDLVDGYIGENPNFFLDFGRNFIRSLNGKSNYSEVTFTRALKKACRQASAVIVASPEQAKDVMPYNSNVHVILDDHSELDRARALRDIDEIALSPHRYVLWEGFGYTIKHFKFISRYLDEFLIMNNLNLQILTNETFARWGGYLGSVDSNKLINKWFPLSKNQIEIIPWTIENLIQAASICDFALIPISPNDKFANLKPENKLLSMWHLGLPTLYSDIQAYKRVANLSGTTDLCIDQRDWPQVFSNFEFYNLENTANQGIKYIAENHTKVILFEKWQAAFNSIMSTNG